MPKSQKQKLEELQTELARMAGEMDKLCEVLRSMLLGMTALAGKLIRLGEREDDIPF